MTETSHRVGAFVGWFCLAILPMQVVAETVEHGYVDSGGVKIHYASQGQGPLLVMLHGFPDYWYTWRKQMPALAENHRVVALDLRGFNKSDQPEGVDQYVMSKLVGDVKAVLDHFDAKSATIVGHDWGGMIAWSFAMQHPDRTDRLVVLNLPHPAALTRELANNPEQKKASAYARFFQQPQAASQLTAESLVNWVKDDEAKPKYIDAMNRSSFESMLNYYKANFPKPPYQASLDFPKVQCSVLMIHGLEDTALLSDGLNGTWDWLAKDLTLITVPEAGHFVQQDAAELVTKRIKNWLELTQEPMP